jgi:transcriptional regulator with XRE-family HTH domain
MQDTAPLAALVCQIRLKRKLSRGQVAKRLKLSPTVVYNVETARSRIKLGYFFQLLRVAGVDPAAALGRHLNSIKLVPGIGGSELVCGFRNRLKLSQRALAESLGYKSASIIHHFEKGIREPDLGDLFGLMELARDNVRGLVEELTGDAALAGKFPAGREAAQKDWREYWAHYYVSAIRQIMRTASYDRLKRYKPGYFAQILGITVPQEQDALRILSQFDLIRWENAKPLIVPGVRIAIPKDTPRELIDQLKVQWWEFGQKRYLAAKDDRTILTVDSLPVSEASFRQIVQRVRDLQDEFHNTPIRDAEGFVQLSWLAAYVPV